MGEDEFSEEQELEVFDINDFSVLNEGSADSGCYMVMKDGTRLPLGDYNVGIGQAREHEEEDQRDYAEYLREHLEWTR